MTNQFDYALKRELLSERLKGEELKGSWIEDNSILNIWVEISLKIYYMLINAVIKLCIVIEQIRNMSNNFLNSCDMKEIVINNF